MKIEQLDKILNIIHKYFNVSEKPEITLEVNPEDIDSSKYIEGIKNLGINRISLGVQSFNNEELKTLSRIHNKKIGIDTFKMISEYFNNINIDIIYDTPSQNTDRLYETLNLLFELKPSHISAYALTIEPETMLFNRFNKKNINSEINRSFINNISDSLKNKGYNHYEISNYCKPGFESKHNLKYWNFEEYLGLGPSSHSFISFKRWNNTKNFIHYINTLSKNLLPVVNYHKPDLKKLKTEYLICTLRAKGVNLKRYKIIFNSDFIKEFDGTLKFLIQGDFAYTNNNFFSLTEKGYLLMDEIISKMLIILD